MGIKQIPETGEWVAFFSKRHPITRMPFARRRKNLKSKAEAIRMERELIATVERILNKATSLPWAESLDQYLNACRANGLHEDTIQDYSYILKAHTTDAWKDKSVNEITTQEIRDLIAEKVGKRSQSHQKNVLKVIRGVFNHALERGLVQRNPAPIMKFRIGEKNKRVLTEPQVRVFLEKANEMDWEWYPHWFLAIYTGMRSGELYALTWAKVNLEDRLIRVDTSWNSNDGFKSTKSGDERVLEIAPKLLTFLKELKLKNSDSHFVLPRINTWDKGLQARPLGVFLQSIGLPRVRFHDLRATWATILLSKGIEPIKVMKMGGWKDMKTMMIYVRTAGIDIRGVSNCLDLHNTVKEEAKILVFEKA